MAKILFEVNYNIYPGKRESYLKSINELKSYIKEVTQKDYFIYEDSKKKNNFSEIIFFESNEDFDNFEDMQDDKIKEMMNNIINTYVMEKKVNYITKETV
jgi:hypothetical protein